MKLKTRRKLLVFILLSAFSFQLLTFSGCEAFRRKFVRKSKREKEVKVVVETQEYTPAYSAGETYRQYFLFWRAAHQELIELIQGQDSRQKRRLFFAQKIVENLEQMRSLLPPEKQASLDGFILRQKELLEELRKDNLTYGQGLRLKRFLERQKSQIQKEFSYQCVQDYFKDF